MDLHFMFTLITIGIAFIFDFLNGFHDSANAISTIVSTRVLKPQWAVVWAAFFNFMAFFIFNVHVANTIAVGLIDPSIIDQKILFSALTSATIWNIFTWYFGIPSSSSHALIGGILGASIAKSSIDSVNGFCVIKVFISIFASPWLGFVLAFLIMMLIVALFANSPRVKTDAFFKKMQLLSSMLVSLGHGGNDAQKTMGIVSMLLFSAGWIGPEFHIPIWVVIACYLAISMGTLLGGWRIVKTMGMRITKLKPVHGCAAEMATACSLFLATFLGIPVSSTHTITGAIVGVGLFHKISSVRWGLASRIVWAWVITIPFTLGISMVIFRCFQYIKK